MQAINKNKTWWCKMVRKHHFDSQLITYFFHWKLVHVGCQTYLHEYWNHVSYIVLYLSYSEPGSFWTLRALLEGIAEGPEHPWTMGMIRSASSDAIAALASTHLRHHKGSPGRPARRALWNSSGDAEPGSRALKRWKDTAASLTSNSSWGVPPAVDVSFRQMK